jgi:hypothetical protein
MAAENRKIAYTVMKITRVLLIVVAIVISSSIVRADGPVGVYAMVQKVVFEPSEVAPKTLQIWGVFVWVDGGLKSPGPINLPQRGYIYFKLPDGATQAAAAKKQWMEIKAIAGGNQIIAFGDWKYSGPFEDLYIPPATGGLEDIRVRKQAEAPAKPIAYPIQMGLVRLADDAAHESLRSLMKAFLQR